MKVLVQNYSSRNSTEAIYFQQTMKTIGIEAVLWNQNQISTYDIFDRFKPDVFIAGHNHLTSDIIEYLSHSKTDTVLNVTGLNESQSNTLNTILIDRKIKVPFVFTNTPDSIPEAKLKDFKSHNILPGADLFIPRDNSLDFTLDAIRIYTNKDLDYSYENNLDWHRTYHMTGLYQSDKFDFEGNVATLGALYNKYKEICFFGNPENIFSQLVFDAMFVNDNVRLLSDDQQKMSKIITGIFKTGNIQEQIKPKHTCISRTQRLLSKLGVDINNNVFEQMIGSLV